MIAMKTLGLAIGIAVASSSFAFAQQGNPPANAPGKPPANAAASGGAGTHQNSLKTGSAASTQKVHRNQNGYRGRRLYGQLHVRHCHLVRHPVTRRLVTVCR
jgi:hypothetical protein